MMDNPYVPYIGRLVDIQPLGTGIKLFRFQFDDAQLADQFDYRPGQFAFVSAFGVGEAPFGITSVRGVDDTIEELDPLTLHGNGVKFREYSPTALVEAIRRALATYADREKWEVLMRRAMSYDFSWEKSAATYLRLYEKIITS